MGSTAFSPVHLLQASSLSVSLLTLGLSIANAHGDEIEVVVSRQPNRAYPRLFLGQ
jgi:hypothetical protein